VLIDTQSRAGFL